MKITTLIAAALVFAACADDPEREPTLEVGPTPSNNVDTDAGIDAGGLADASAGVDTGQLHDAGRGFEAGWTTVAPLGVGPRQETAVVNLDERIYVIGGYDGGIQIVPTVEVWDPATRSWSRAADLPVAMHHANAVAHAGKIYLLGFLGPGFAADGRSFVYDPDADTWSPIADMPPGTERGSSAIGVIDDRIYVFAGLRGGAVTDGSYYEPATDTWTRVAAAPRPFDHAAFGVFGGELVVAGGRNQSIGAHVADVDRYDPQTDSWRSGTPMPTSRAGVAGATYDGKLWVIGGEGNAAEATGVFAQVESYDPVTDSWTQYADMPDPRHGMGAAGFAKGILVPGGAREQAFGAVDAADVFVP
jgi:N-acetylneuraminic acid mutarotase